VKVVLWHNILSLHQAAFIRALAEMVPTILVAERPQDEDWLRGLGKVPDMGRAETIIAPDSQQIDQLVRMPDAMHFVCGIDFAFRREKLLKRLHRVGAKVACYVEPYVWNDGRGWQRRLKYCWLRMRYGKCLDALFVTGDTGRRCYRQVFFPESKLFDWGYFTVLPEGRSIGELSHDKPRILFVGRLDANKNSLLLIRTFQQLRLPATLTLIGDGRLRPEVEAQIAGDEAISFLGLLPNDEVHRQLICHDILVLPSHYDGWGAVVNEALQNGVRVVCSENCGAAALLDDPVRGTVFSFRGSPSLAEALCAQVAAGPQSPEARQALMTWAAKHISGKAVAEYFLAVCAYLGGEVKTRPVAPWRG